MEGPEEDLWAPSSGEIKYKWRSMSTVYKKKPNIGLKG